MSDPDNDSTDASRDVSTELNDDVKSSAVTSPYKILGLLDADDGVGVLGQNDADSGTPIGVKGVVPNNSEGYGLETPDAVRIGGKLSTYRDFQIEIGGNTVGRVRDDGTAGIAGNVEFGHSSNENFSDGVTVSGGGFDDGSTDDGHYIGDQATFATIGGGRGNAINSLVDPGSAEAGTIAGGRYNEIQGGKHATVPGGRSNEASGNLSFAAGHRAKATEIGSFVWADSTNSDVTASGRDQFLIDADGGVGIGTESPQTQLHVADSISDKATTSNHVAAVENTSTSGSADVLSLKIGEDSSNIGSGNNYVTFKDTNDNSLGAIQGDGSGGVTNASGGADYAEWLPRAIPEEEMEAGDVVGVHAGEIRLETAGADRVLVVSRQPVVAGNDPGPEAAARRGHEQVAFLGQAPVRVRGRVESGDLIVPSGEHDGTARAVAADAYGPGDGPLVGQAWESAGGAGITEVTVAVGLETGSALTGVVRRQQATIDEQTARIDELESRLAALEAGADATPAPADD